MKKPLFCIVVTPKFSLERKGKNLNFFPFFANLHSAKYVNVITVHAQVHSHCTFHHVRAKVHSITERRKMREHLSAAATASTVTPVAATATTVKPTVRQVRCVVTTDGYSDIA